MIVRQARDGDADEIYQLIETNRERGHLLKRTKQDVATHVPRFYVAEFDGRVVGCGELARLSATVSEVRSLVVDERWRGNGLAGKIVAALHRRARLEGHERLCAFAHDPVPFMHLGFSIVPHAWLPEKISADCAGCALFRQCGQFALMISLPCSRQSDAA